MVIKYYTIQNPPICGGEISKEPSQTRQSDNMDIKETLERFFRMGGKIPPQQGANDLTEEEKELLFSEPDLMDADLVEQKNFVDEIQGQLNSVKDEQEQEQEQVEHKEESVAPAVTAETAE